MSVISSPALFMGEDGYQISRSVRLRSSASAYLSRTPASAGNRTTWTWSGWVKLGTLGVSRYLLNAGTGPNTFLYLNSSNVLGFSDYTSGPSYNFELITTQVFRDPSAWYHIVAVVDTTQGTSSNRVKLYVNGSQVTALSTATYPSSSFQTGWNNNVAHQIGWNAASAYFDGYLTEINFIDGQALTPSSFGENDSITGVWKPKKYAGTYGTNGFYLNFSDNSAATAAAIGKDSSGNGNNWTPNNISVTSGSTYDSMLDTPTPYADGGNGRGNYATFNPVQSAGSYAATFADGNLKVTSSSSSAGQTSQVTTISLPATENWYAEVTAEYVSASSQHLIGIVQDTYNPSSATDNPFTLTSIGYGYNNDGNKRTNSSNASYGATWGTGNVIGIHLNNGTLTFYKDGTSQGSAFTGLTGNFYIAVAGYNSDRYVLNAGQRPFAYTPPSGYKALNTQNLPDSTIKKGNQYFDVSTWSGTGSAQSITNSGGFAPDFVWGKIRSSADYHVLANSIVGPNVFLKSNTTDAETTNAQTITAFNSNGFSVGTSTDLNRSGYTFVGWQWKAGGAGSSNTSGSITSTVSVNAAAGFSVVTYTGTGANATVGHGLGVAPSMIILKQRNAVDYWVVWQTTLGSTGYLLLNSTNASSTAATYWNSTTPTSTVFSLGSDSRPNGSGTTYVAYCFAAVAGYSAFGSYTGNGSADGPFVYCGFRPRYILVKNASAATDWWIVDTARDTYNVANLGLKANGSSTEIANTYSDFDILSNGFKVRRTSSEINGSGNTLIFAAFAENPFKNALAR